MASKDSEKKTIGIYVKVDEKTFEKLDSIIKDRSFDSVAQAVRFCIRRAYDVDRSKEM